MKGKVSPKPSELEAVPMDQPDREAAPHFSQPVRQITLMLMVFGLTGFGAFVALPRVLPVFLANLYLNGFILAVFVIGVLSCFWQVFQLFGSVRWIEDFVAGRPGHSSIKAPRLLAPLATLMRQRSGKRMQIASTSARSILDSVAQRIDEAREITRYIVNLLIFLGLLGTFYGLATTVPAVVDTIRGLAPHEGESGTEVFSRLMTGLESQLGGMGVAFSSSLLGLAGSLVVGLLELFAGHGQNRFYRELEEWMSSITRVSFATGDEKLGVLADSIERLTHRMSETSPVNAALIQVADGQERLIAAIEAQAAAMATPESGLDAESRMRLRSIDVQMLRILEEISAGRQETMNEIRTDLAALTKIFNQLRTVDPAPRRTAPARKRGADRAGEEG